MKWQNIESWLFPYEMETLTKVSTIAKQVRLCLNWGQCMRAAWQNIKVRIAIWTNYVVFNLYKYIFELFDKYVGAGAKPVGRMACTSQQRQHFLQKFTLQLKQIHLSIWINIFWNLDRYFSESAKPVGSMACTSEQRRRFWQKCTSQLK